MRKGYSQADVAKMLNLSRQAYNIYETGKTYPRTEKLEQLAEIFGVPISYFSGGESGADDGGITDSRDRMLIGIINALSEDNKKQLIDYTELLSSAERDGVKL